MPAENGVKCGATAQRAIVTGVLFEKDHGKKRRSETLGKDGTEIRNKKKKRKQEKRTLSGRGGPNSNAHYKRDGHN